MEQINNEFEQITITQQTTEKTNKKQCGYELVERKRPYEAMTVCQLVEQRKKIDRKLFNKFNPASNCIDETKAKEIC